MDSERSSYFSFYFRVCLKFYIIKKSKDIRIRKKGNHKPILWVSGNTCNRYFTCDNRECYRHA